MQGFHFLSTDAIASSMLRNVMSTLTRYIIEWKYATNLTDFHMMTRVQGAVDASEEVCLQQVT
jgi:hypothetical protein